MHSKRVEDRFESTAELARELERIRAAGLDRAGAGDAVARVCPEGSVAELLSSCPPFRLRGLLPRLPLRHHG